MSKKGLEEEYSKCHEKLIEALSVQMISCEAGTSFTLLPFSPFDEKACLSTTAIASWQSLECTKIKNKINKIEK